MNAQLPRTLFDDDHNAFRAVVREFIEGEVVPHLERWAAAGSVDREFYEAAGRVALLGPAVPEPYGGGGVDDFRYSMVITEELCRVGANAVSMSIGDGRRAQGRHEPRLEARRSAHRRPAGPSTRQLPDRAEAPCPYDHPSRQADRRRYDRGGRAGDVLRGLLAPRLHLVPGLRARVLASETPPLSFVLRPVFPRTAAGRLCPNARIAPDADSSRLDDVAGEGFTVVAGSFTAPEWEQVRRAGAVPVLAEHGSELRRWLNRRRIRVAVVRPDRTVMVTARSVADGLGRLPSFSSPSGTWVGPANQAATPPAAEA